MFNCYITNLTKGERLGYLYNLLEEELSQYYIPVGTWKDEGFTMNFTNNSYEQFIYKRDEKKAVQLYKTSLKI